MSCSTTARLVVAEVAGDDIVEAVYPQVGDEEFASNSESEVIVIAVGVTVEDTSEAAGNLKRSNLIGPSLGVATQLVMIWVKEDT